jgi:N-acetyl-gamma-glutamyl-phosphate reductase
MPKAKAGQSKVFKTSQAELAMLKVGIIGGSGYTGAELLRLLLTHPKVEVTAISSRQDAGKPVSALFPSFYGHSDLVFVPPESPMLRECDLLFFATPHGVAAAQAAEFLNNGKKVIDLSADFRLQDITLWEKWYGLKHPHAALVKEAVYGLPELPGQRAKIANARLIANPGCYPTAVALAALPLLRLHRESPLPTKTWIADAKSGISGAGRKAELSLLFAETSENFQAYGLSGHRHQPEIEAIFATTATPPTLVFQPHLLPMTRGMQVSLYVGETPMPLEKLQKYYEDFYQAEKFIQVLPLGQSPQTKAVRGSNFCQIALSERSGQLVVFSVIDNLVKGASGQALQNLNLLFGFPEHLGLVSPALLP